MVVVKGLDRLDGTLLSGMSDELWQKHTKQLMEMWESEQERDPATRFDEYCAKCVSIHACNDANCIQSTGCMTVRFLNLAMHAIELCIDCSLTSCMRSSVQRCMDMSCSRAMLETRERHITCAALHGHVPPVMLGTQLSARALRV